MKPGWLLGLLLIGLLSSEVASAGQLHLNINGRSYHFGNSSANYNEDNRGFGFQYDFYPSTRRWFPSLFAGWLVDSYNDDSYMAGVGYSRRHILVPGRHGLQFDIGGAASIMTRETINGGYPFPIVFPTASIGTQQVGLNIVYIPQYINTSTLFFQLRYALQ